jgi:hypothetical protein
MNRYASLTLFAATFCLAGCRTNSLLDRSLIFSTHTSLGIEVSVSPSETSSPAKLLIGYKRSEGVFNPVYYNLDMDEKAGVNRKVEDYYRPEAYSVIAKFEGSATAGGATSADTKVATGKTDAAGKEIPGATGVVTANVKGGMTLSQWFATGEAATILARYGAPALTDNPAVAAATAGAAESNLKTIPLATTAEAIAYHEIRDKFNTLYNTAKHDPDQQKKDDAVTQAKAILTKLSVQLKAGASTDDVFVALNQEISQGIGDATQRAKVITAFK